ncbi:hypothetical protein [Aeromicrobium sp. Root495]|uniref:hypothetical protein n=1 Tax=Aeromicrobium sp. Root495 TaxID=1736550 RepID=UPI000AC3C37C|nr:hypothetical protein [Aeromicrobium sp. Root495]
MATRGARRSRLQHLRHRYAATLVICALVVALSVWGLATNDQHQGYSVIAFTALALVAALVAVGSTIARAKVGQDVGEQELDHHA